MLFFYLTKPLKKYHFHSSRAAHMHTFALCTHIDGRSQIRERHGTHQTKCTHGKYTEREKKKKNCFYLFQFRHRTWFAAWRGFVHASCIRVIFGRFRRAVCVCTFPRVSIMYAV